MPRRGRVAAGLTLLLAATLPAAACELPVDEGSAPMRRLVARVKYLPETESWSELMSRTRTTVHYILLLEEPRRVDGHCHWPVEIRAEDKLWKRFLVPGAGGKVIELPAGG
ncbi:MAG: hypothetical protein ACT4P9_06515 [Betaproteobacteria bacterium]